jgi:AsmA-like C-terminal region
MTNFDKEEFYRKLFAFKDKAFSFIYEAESLFNRIVLLGILTAFLLWFNMGNIINFLVSESSIKKNIIASLSEITGKKADIAGEVMFKSEPEPVAVISKIKILNNSILTDQNYFEAETIKTKPSIVNALLGREDFNYIFIENAKMNIDSTAALDEKTNISGELLKMLSKKGRFYKKTITFKNLQVNFYKKNPLNDKKPIVKRFDFPELELSPNKGNSFEIKGSFDSQKFREVYFFNLNLKEGFGADSDFQGKIYSTTSELKLSGKVSTKDKVSFYGKLEGKFGGLSKKLFSLLGFTENFLESLRDTDKTNLSANFIYDSNKFEINDFTSDGNIISFVMNQKATFGKITNAVVDINVTKFNYSQMFKTQLEMLSEKKIQRAEEDFKKRLEDYFLFALKDDTNFSFTMNIPKIDFFNDKQGSLYVRAVLKNNQIKINSFKARLPGDSALSFVGVAEINKEEQKLKGASRIILAGKNMDELALALNGEKTKGSRFGTFYIDAKGFLYGQNIHFREIVAKINEDRMAGQMLIDYSNELKASAAFNFSSLNIDKYLVTDRDVDTSLAKEENALALKFEFLRTIDSIFDKLDLSMQADNMVKAGENYKDVSLFAQITPGLTEVRDLYFSSPLLGEVSGKVRLDLTDFQPKMDLDLIMDKYDLDLLMYGAPVVDNDTYNFEGKWNNKDTISFEMFGNFVGKLTLNIEELKVFHFIFKNLVFSSHAEENKFIIEDARTDIFGNKMSFKGYISTDSPAFNISFVASDFDAIEFLSKTFNLDQVTSIFNMSGALSSSGYSIEQMMQNLTGKISVVAKDFKVNGFDLSAVGRALPLAKRREYVNLVSDELLNKGETQFGFFSGSFYIDSGLINFENLGVVSPNISKGTISGVIDIPKWQAEINSNMMVKTTDGVDFSLQGKATGTIPHIQTEWDEKGMFKFWEDKFYGIR